jgi:hypothetical protein
MSRALYIASNFFKLITPMMSAGEWKRGEGEFTKEKQGVENV